MPSDMIFLIKKLAKKPYYFFLDLKKRVRNALVPTARILLYHRVEDAANDPHKLCVGKENFHSQIEFLKRNFRVISLAQLAQEVISEKVQNNTIVITFDDGYADNLHNALPILEKFNVPATVFLTAGYISPTTSKDQPQTFYWDQNTPSEERGRPLAPDEAKQLSQSRLIEIGAHSLSHPKLAKLAENEQFKEIAESKAMVEKMFSITLSGFAYPFGGKDSFDKTTVKLTKRANFKYACANIHERVTNKSNIFALPRFVVRNWELEEFKKQLNNF